jgi:hypothetical protein
VILSDDVHCFRMNVTSEDYDIFVVDEKKIKEDVKKK